MAEILIFISLLLPLTTSGLALWVWGSGQKKWNTYDLVGGFVIGTVFFTWVVLGLSLALGQIAARPLLLFLFGATLLSFFYLIRKRFIAPPLSRKTLGKTCFFGGLTVLGFFIFPRLLFWQSGELFSGWITVWGDWAAHLAYTTGFVYGRNFPPQMPIFAGQVLSYPFLTDLFSAFLLKLNLDITAALVFPSLLFTLSAIILLTRLAANLSGKFGSAALAALLFLGNGGLGIYYVLQQPDIYSQATKIDSQNIQWANVLTTQFVPQRGFALAFPLALIVFYLLWQIWQGKAGFRLYFLAGTLTALVVLVHAHSFLVIILVSGWVFLKDFLRSRRRVFLWLGFALPILILALPAIYYFYFGSRLNSFFQFKPGWMARGNIFLFWLKNFCPMLFLSLVGLFFMPRTLRLFLLPFFSLFILAHLFLFQPWDWDNSKLLTYWYLGAAISAGILLQKMFASKNPFFLVFALVLFALSTVSGFYDVSQLFRFEKNKQRLFGRQQVTAAEFIKENTPSDAVFLTADNHDNPVASLAGRKIFLGFPGWLWSYGIDYAPRQQIVAQIKEGGPEAKRLLAQNGIDYVFIGPVEISRGFNKAFFDTNYPTIYSRGEDTVYKINGDLTLVK